MLLYFTFECQVNSLMEEFKSKDEDVAAIIAEPIQSEGGDHYSTPYFFQGLQKLCKKVHYDFMTVMVVH